jgi:ribonuclease P protein component
VLRAALPTQGLPDHDHVLIGRAGGVERDFQLMADELAKALERAREGRGDPSGGRRPRRGNRAGKGGR